MVADEACSPLSQAWDLIVDQVGAMVKQEGAYYDFPEPCDLFRQAEKCPGSISGDEANVCRRKMCEWAFHVVDYFDYSRDTVSMSLNFVDRYVTTLVRRGITVSRKRYQSISVTALYLTLKLQGSSRMSRPDEQERKRRRLLSIDTFVELGRGMLTVELLEQEERRMLSGMKYQLNPPTAVMFVEYLVLILIPKNAQRMNPFVKVEELDERSLHYVFELSRYFTELAVFDVALSARYRPSCVAVAAILNALEALKSVAVPVNLDETFVSNATSLITKLEMEDVQQSRDLLSKLCPPDSLEWPWSETQDAPVSPCGRSGNETCDDGLHSPLSVRHNDLH